MRLLILLILLPFISEGQIIHAKPLYRPFAASNNCTDSDAQAFIDSAGITDQTQKDAICTLVKELKDSSLWSSFKAIYPMIGGTASSHKWNLKDPRNLDAAYRLTFSGTWTHSSTGADPNGTNAYAQTYLIPSTHLTNNSVCVTYYSRESVTGVQELMASFNSGSQNIQLFVNNSSTGDIAIDAYCTSVRAIGNATNTTGFIAGSRTSSSSVNIFKNAISYGSSATSTVACSGQPNIQFYLGAANSGGSPVLYTSAECAFASISDGLTSDQVRALNTIVEKFNDALGRGVQ